MCSLIPKLPRREGGGGGGEEEGGGGERRRGELGMGLTDVVTVYYVYLHTYLFQIACTHPQSMAACL